MMYDIFYYLFSYDIFFYVSHILLHTKDFYYIHKTHHETKYEELTYLHAGKGDILENIIQYSSLSIPLIIIKFDLFQFLIAFTLIQIRGLMRHDHNYVWLIGNHHLLHHKNRRYNYGEYWLDTLFGTKYPNSDEYVYGIIYT